MTGYELVRSAIEFESPERLPFFQHVLTKVPDDVTDSWEMDRAKAGWFFDTPGWTTGAVSGSGRRSRTWDRWSPIP